jgi:hypothetical protein
MRRKRALKAAATAGVLGLASAISPASATTYSSNSYLFWEWGQAGAGCMYSYATGVVPSIDGSSSLDHNAFVFRTARPASCSTGNTWVNIVGNGVAGATAQATLRRQSDLALCQTSSSVSVPSGYAFFGVGRAFNGNGNCADPNEYSAGQIISVWGNLDNPTNCEYCNPVVFETYK